MRASGAAATCVPVRTDEHVAPAQEWEAAIFLQLAGPECKADRRAISRSSGPLPLGMETDLIEAETGAVVVLRLEVHTLQDDPFVCEILLAPGAGGSHFDSLKLLTKQPRLNWFFGDQTYWLLGSQAHPLQPDQHAEFDSLLKDALAYDAMVRMTKHYDAQAALGHVARLYELRASAALRTETAGSAAGT